ERCFNGAAPGAQSAVLATGCARVNGMTLERRNTGYRSLVCIGNQRNKLVSAQHEHQTDECDHHSMLFQTQQAGGQDLDHQYQPNTAITANVNSEYLRK